MIEHLNEFQSVVNQLSSMKMSLKDELQALLLLSSIPDNWKTLIVSVSNSAPDGIVTISLVTSSLLNEELRSKYLGSSHSEALVTQRRGRTKSQERGNHSKSRSKSRPRQNVTFYHCKKVVMQEEKHD